MKPNIDAAQNNHNGNEDNAASTNKPQLSGVKRYKKGRSFADTLFGKMRYGKDLVTGQWVAIKENRKWFAQNRVSIKGDPVPEDLFDEIKMMKYLGAQQDVPPHILQLLDVVEDDVYIYLVLELVDGGDFFAFIHNNHKQMESECIKQDVEQKSMDKTDVDKMQPWELRMRKVFHEIAVSIKWLHLKQVCHLDISLENALIDKHDGIKIIDFGLSKYFALSSFAMAAKRMGKPRCMSPEVFNVQRFDARAADTWSVGIMLFMMLLGIPPWNLPAESETIYRMVRAGRIRDVIVYNNKKHMLSNHALDLLIRFFKPQNERIYLDQVLLHPFSYY